MKSCIIFGGAGFIGTHLAQYFLRTGRFRHIHIADIRTSPLAGKKGITTSLTDVRKAIPTDLINSRPDWIFNLAAIHREPGHNREEYFETNLEGAKNICAYAEAVHCRNIYFTSSISVYGPTSGPTDEQTPIQPSTPYGSSKYAAELIHEAWKRGKSNRRLIISRPGVIYGPGDPGNILRMIKAVRKGYFAFPGSATIYKSYGYIYGLLDSIDFVMNGQQDLLRYNYVESPTVTLGELVKAIKEHFNVRALTLPLPLWILSPLATAVQSVWGNETPIHPVRIRKAATETHIVPRVLKELNFKFQYDFESSLKHWQAIAPRDFGELPLPVEQPKTSPSISLKLKRGIEKSKATTSVTERKPTAKRKVKEAVH